ncbi:MAG: hypothetical protein ACI4RN_02330 [Oscillospiraceae bacterium]
MTDLDNDLLKTLKSNHYSRRIKSNFNAYGGNYDFLKFFKIENNGMVIGLASMFNSTLIISTLNDVEFDDECIKEISVLISMNKPVTIELENQYADKLNSYIRKDYNSIVRKEFQYISKNSLPDIDVNETPELDDVFNVLKTGFPEIAAAYPMWLTDTSHRIRHGLAQSFLMGNYSTASIQYIVDRIALIGHVATIPEERGKFHARQLLFWIGEKLTADGFDVRLMARPHRVSYYEEIGFKDIASDIVFERK